MCKQLFKIVKEQYLDTHLYVDINKSLIKNC